MPDLKHTTDKDDNLLEGRAQVDPLLFEGPAKRWRIWAVAIVYNCVHHGGRSLRSVVADAAASWAASGSSMAEVTLARLTSRDPA